MVEANSRLIEGLTPLQVESMGTPIPDFRALHHIPSEIGHRAHNRLEQLVGLPIASSDAAPDASNQMIGQRSGERLGNLVGRSPEFTRNLPQIKANAKAVAEERGVSVSEVWDEVVEVMAGSGIGEPMFRTLDRPVGGAYGAREFIKERADSGILMVIRGAIDNWNATKFEGAVTTLGTLPESVRRNIAGIALVGSRRTLKGPTELWRSELQPHVTETEDGPVTDLTEASVAREVRGPALRTVLDKLGLGEQVPVVTLETADQPNGKPATGDEVMRTFGWVFEDTIKDRLVIEFGNAPAGYIQLAGGLLLAKEFGIDPTEQFLAIAPNRVDMVRTDFFDSLTPEQKSKRQNAATALNSFNGWQQKITEVNQYLLDRSQPN